MIKPLVLALVGCSDGEHNVPIEPEGSAVLGAGAGGVGAGGAPTLLAAPDPATCYLGTIAAGAVQATVGAKSCLGANPFPPPTYNPVGPSAGKMP